MDDVKRELKLNEIMDEYDVDRDVAELMLQDEQGEEELNGSD